MNKSISIALIISMFLMFLMPGKALASDLSARVITDKTSYTLNETVRIVFSVTNNADSSKEITFNNSQTYNFIVYKDGKIIFNWAQGRMFADVITKLAFEPKETKSFSEKWDMKDNKGNSVPEGIYTLEFSLKSGSLFDSPVSATVQFTIGQVDLTPVFPDVNDYFILKYLKILYEKGIVKGYPDKTFKPERNLTRAEAIVLIMRALGLERKTYNLATFIDVPKEHWAFSYIEEGVELGLIKGKTVKTFEPGTPITRGEFVVVLMRALEFDLSESPSAFADVNEDYFGFREVTTAYSLGIVQGKEVKDSKLYFYPGKSITRSEAILIIGRALELKTPQM